MVPAAESAPNASARRGRRLRYISVSKTPSRCRVGGGVAEFIPSGRQAVCYYTTPYGAR